MNRHSVRATWLSAFIMGSGQFYNRQYTKAAIFFITKILTIYFFIFSFPGSLKGLITLGEFEQSTDEFGVTTQGDDSRFLMVYGLIAIIVGLILIGIYIFNIRDARVNGRLIDQGKTPLNFFVELSNASSRQFPIFLLILPGLGILFFTIFPLIFGILFAFTNYNVDHLPPGNLIDWIGLDVFKELVFLEKYSGTFYNVATWTIIWAISATVTTYFGGMFVAILIQQKEIKFKKFWRTALILPYAIPQFISLLIWQQMMNYNFGPLNKLFEQYGFQLIHWLDEYPAMAKTSIILVNMWIGIPVSMILITGILTTISKDLYEAADVDGANDFQKFRMITMPMILFSTAPILIMQFAGNINNFNVIFLLTNGAPSVDGYETPAGSTDLLVTWLFKLSGLGGQGNPQYNLASAIGIIIFIVIATVSIISFRRTKSFKESDMIQ